MQESLCVLQTSLVGAKTVTDVRGLVAAARMGGDFMTAASSVDKSDTPEATLAMVAGTRTLSMTSELCQ